MLDEVQVLLKQITDKALQAKLTSLLQGIDAANLPAQEVTLLPAIAELAATSFQGDQEIVRNVLKALLNFSVPEDHSAKTPESNPFMPVEMACLAGNIDAALEILHAMMAVKSITKDQEDVVQHNLGYLYALKKDWPTANHHFERALQCKESMATYADYALVALHNGQIELAKKLFVKTVSLMQDFNLQDLLVYYQSLDQEYFGQDTCFYIELEKSDQLFIHPVPFACQQLIQLEFEAEKYLNILQNWIDQYLALPERPFAQMYCHILGKAYELSGNLLQAESYYSQAADLVVLPMPKQGNVSTNPQNFWLPADDLEDFEDDPELAMAIAASLLPE